MFLQTLFALSSLYPAIIASAVPSTTNEPTVAHRTLTVQGARRFTAEMLSPRVASVDARYPGAIIIATDSTRDRAYLIASRMAEIGITVLMYVQDGSNAHETLVSDAWAAVDSVRRRYDVRPEEVGVIAFEEATGIVPDLASDTTLNFAIAASSIGKTPAAVKSYTNVRAATLLVRGIKNASDSASLAHVLGGAPVVRQPADSLDDDALLPQRRSIAAPNVTVWPVPQDQLKAIGDAHSPLGVRVVSWVREQVHANLYSPDEVSVSAP